MTGNSLVCSLLEKLGVRVVFGMPGSETIGLFDALRKSALRTVLTVDERAAAFMANGYYRASGSIAAVVVISGPGFTNALTGLAEARHDSAGLICLAVGTDRFPEKQFRLQVLDQQAMAAAVVKRGYRVERPADLQRMLPEAYVEAVTAEPGPILVECTDGVLGQTALMPDETGMRSESLYHIPPDEDLDRIAEAVSRANRIVLYAGQGAAGAVSEVYSLATSLNCPVLTTGSGRGIIPENHPLSCYFDYSRGRGSETVNNIIRQCDLVLALGVKFSHNGTGGFRLKIPAEKLVHVDASAAVLGANYLAALTVQGDVPEVVRRLIKRIDRPAARPPGWTAVELASLREQIREEKDALVGAEPIPLGIGPGDMATFFDIFRQALPDNACVVTDCGLHQTLTRNYFEVRSPRGMICPTDFQSMGFGIPAAIGAKLAAPRRPVVAIVGDGGFAMSAMELATAVREKIPLTVVVFNDGKLGSIRLQQFERAGQEHAVDLHNPDFEQLARALGVSYARWDDLTSPGQTDSLLGSDVRLLEVRLIDSPAILKTRVSGRTRDAARSILGPRVTESLKKWLGR
jgi:acetolactate synthase-1/2/3 large subunit